MSRGNIGLSVDLDTDLRTIVVGGPKTGKTTVAQNSEWTAIAHPKQAKDVSSKEPVIIDDFYIQFEQCFGDRDLIDEATRDAFTSLCMRDSGICFTLRPRELDWLLTNREQATQVLDPDTTEVQYIKYSESDTKQICSELDEKNGGISSYFDSLYYDYSFDTDVYDFDKYESYIPYLLVQIAEQDLSGGLLPDAIQQAVSKVGANSDWFQLGKSYKETASGLWGQMPAGIESIIGAAKENLNSELAAVGAGAAATTIAPVAAFAALPLACNMLFAEDAETEAKNVFGNILSNEMLPHAQAQLEAEIGLPPRTIEALGKLSDPAVLESINNRITSNEKQVEEILAELDQYQAHIEELKRLDADLQSRVTPLQKIISERFRNAIRLPGDTFARDRAARQQRIADATEWSTSRVQSTTADLVDAYRAAYADTAKNTIEATTDDPFTAVIRGAPGLEKWACLEEIATQYQSEGNVVGVVDSLHAEFLKPRLRALDRNDQNIVLIYRYRAGINPEQIRQIFEKELAGLYDALIFECTPAMYYSLREVWETPPDPSTSLLGSTIAPDLTLEIDGFDRAELAPVVNALGVTDSEVVQEIIQFAEGRPLVAFDSTLTYMGEGPGALTGYSGIESLYPSIENTVNNLDSTAPSGINPRHIMDTLSAVGYVSGDSYADALAKLATMAGVENTGEAVEFMREYMTGIIQREGTGCRLNLAAIGIVWNEKRWFRDESLEQPSYVFNDIVERICNVDLQYIRSLIINTKTIAMHADADSWSQSLAITDLLQRLFEITKTIDDLERARVLYTAVHHRLYLPADAIIAICDGDLTLKAARQYSRAVARFAAQYLIHEQPDAFERLIGVARDLRSGFDSVEIPTEADDIWVFGYAFYEVTYTLAVEEGLPIIKQIEPHLETAVADSEISDIYITHTYAIGIWPHLQLGASAETYADWILEFEQMAIDRTGLDQIEAIIELYTSLVSTQPTDSPEKIDDWLRFVENRVDAAGERKSKAEDAMQLQMSARSHTVSEYYSTLIATLIEQLSEDRIDVWVDSIGRRAANRFSEISDIDSKQVGDRSAYNIRPLCLIYGGTVRRFNGNPDQLRSLLPKIVQSAEKVLKTEHSEHYSQIYTVCGQLLGNYILNIGTNRLQTVTDSLVEAVSYPDEVEFTMWVGLPSEAAIVIEACAEIISHAAPDSIGESIPILWDEYHRLVVKQNQRIVPGCRPASSYADLHTFYGLIILRTAWYKHPDQVSDDWWEQIEEHLSDYGSEKYSLETSESQLAIIAGDQEVLKAYAIGYRLLTGMFSPNEQNIAWLEQIEWRMFNHSGDDGIATVLADSLCELFSVPSPYTVQWIQTLIDRNERLPDVSAGRGHVLILDNLPLDSLSLPHIRQLATQLGSTDTTDSIYEFAESVGNRSLAYESLNNILSRYDGSAPNRYLRDQIRKAANESK